MCESLGGCTLLYVRVRSVQNPGIRVLCLGFKDATGNVENAPVDCVAAIGNSDNASDAERLMISINHYLYI